MEVQLSVLRICRTRLRPGGVSVLRRVLSHAEIRKEEQDEYECECKSPKSRNGKRGGLSTGAIVSVAVVAVVTVIGAAAIAWRRVGTLARELGHSPSAAEFFQGRKSRAAPTGLAYQEDGYMPPAAAGTQRV
eukprot:CAMPEP_0182858122 /NCGR_PEP_ID=MMETSP0034_2-20130328/3475_1 /TAXON_ID=156128 /ORGANISM="Nephroselmis pyriformis, Strain CCMP717" /LENGTH=131 /DNA_ID=CAMNT_0024989475 /DNA_START=301 /DNA_END=697 /DNA_ORIENTATION=-